MDRLKKNSLFWITMIYFILPFINITFAMSALLCMFFPFYLAARTKKKAWCQGICPRADFLDLFKKRSLKKLRPAWMKGNFLRDGILTYFCINIMLISLSTYMVSQGDSAPIDKIRLFIVFQLPWGLPQIINWTGISPALLHFSYRMYSIMLSSTILGVIFALLYKPRTWCTVCPVNTMTGRMLKKWELQNIQ